MTFKLTINCDNDAFYGEQKHEELARILREIADALEEYGGLMGTVVRDVNGNTVGKASFK
jgi:sulfur carrier protein ThiS